MFAIQQLNGKFVVPKYFLSDEVFDVVISAKPKLYATRTEAKEDAAKAEEYVLKCLNNYCKRKVEAEQDMAASEKKLDRLLAKASELEKLPYVEVASKMEKLLKEVTRARQEYDYAASAIAEARRGEARWAKTYDQKFLAVEVQISVDKVVA